MFLPEHCPGASNLVTKKLQQLVLTQFSGRIIREEIPGHLWRRKRLKPDGPFRFATNRFKLHTDRAKQKAQACENACLQPLSAH